MGAILELRSYKLTYWGVIFVGWFDRLTLNPQGQLNGHYQNLPFVVAYISSIPVVGWSENVYLNCCHGKAGVLEDLGRAQVSQILCQLTE